MSASQMFSVQLQLDWTIKTIAVLMQDPCNDLGKITDGTVTPCTLGKMTAESRTVEKDIKLDLLFLTGIVKYKDSHLHCQPHMV